MKIWFFRRHFSSLPTINFFLLSPSKLTHLLQLCSKSKGLIQVKQTHQQIIQHGLHKDPFILTKLIQCYSDCDHLSYAHHLFDEMPEPNVFAWTSLLTYYSRHGLFYQCLQAYGVMRFQGLMPDQYVFPKVLRACAQLSELLIGSMIHKEVIVCGVELNTHVCSSLIDMYAKCWDVESARLVFDNMVVRDILSWNAMISGYVANGFTECAVELFGLMGCSGVEADLVTLNSVMDAYCRKGLCDNALEVFGKIMQPNVISWTILVSGYSRIGNHEASLKIFRDMMKGMTFVPDLDSLSSAMVSCRHLKTLRNGKEVHAFGIKIHNLTLFYKSVGPALLTMYSRCGRGHDMRNVFKLMDKFDAVTWNAMIFSLVDQAMGDSAVEAFNEMQKLRIKNDQTTISTILPVCDLKSGKQIHAFIIRNDFDTVAVSNALICMYCNCGSINDANLIFSNMDARDMVSWNIIIGGLGRHGEGEAALQLLKDMISCGLHPNSVTLTSVLSACCHSGLVQEGLELFHNMTSKYGLVPKIEHFACVVDMLARGGQLNDALDIVQGMPVKPDKHIWGTLLAAGQALHNVEVAKLAAENLVSLEPENAGHYVTLSNIYAEDGRWDDAVRIRGLMESRGLMKPTANSWILGSEISSMPSQL